MAALSRANLGKWINTTITILINAALWIIPSNVPYLIAQNRDVLLGRYSLERLVAILVIVPISIASLYLTWSPAQKKKERQFKVMAVAISVLICLLIVDTGLRLAQPKRYIVRQSYLHRTPNAKYTGLYQDVPEKAFLYATTPPAYPDIEYTLTTDKRGFRNQTDLEEYDLIAIGDSFTEGSNIADNQSWPALLAQKTQLTVYNLGMSAGNPASYLETLSKFGLQLSPRIVLCMLYEGNDFRDANFRNKNSFREHLNRYADSSPVRNALKQFLVRSLASNPGARPKGDSQAEADREDQAKSPATDKTADGPLSWLPVGIPEGPGSRYYTFKVKRLLDHYVTRESFRKSKGCKKTCQSLARINETCRRNNARLIVLYAPDKPHTIVPLLNGIVTPEQLRAFMALREKNLPPVEKLMGVLAERLEVQESTFEDFCRAESIEFLSLTAPLREAIAQGKQAYFTYDQHWTPVGHEIVVNALSAYFKEHP
ncbi:MAG: hypothetical protein JSU94_12070 [Phycisphaerales bacterium]|nr:MAG: hypothetical protein JSU94_12070 [Phycisphaerales bacterium]